MVMVVDASIAIAWCIEAESTAESVALLGELRDTTGVVPPIWPSEVVNALLVAERRGRMPLAQTERALWLLRQLPIAVVDRSLDDAIDALLPLARRENRTLYDASYLELAIRDGCALATLDSRMRAAAGRVGVQLATAGKTG